jgi:anti-sigma factor NepR-like protein
MPWHMPDEDAEQRVARAIRAALAQHLRQYYADVVRDPLPPDLAALLQRLDDSSGLKTAPIAA